MVLIYSVAFRRNFRVECRQLQLGFGLTAVAMCVHGNATADTRALRRSTSASYQLGHCRMTADDASVNLVAGPVRSSWSLVVTAAKFWPLPVSSGLLAKSGLAIGEASLPAPVVVFLTCGYQTWTCVSFPLDRIRWC